MSSRIAYKHYNHYKHPIRVCKGAYNHYKHPCPYTALLQRLAYNGTHALAVAYSGV